MGLHHRIVIIGGGNAGLSVAARLRHAGQDDIAVVEPSDQHYYQPLWTLVGGGRAPAKESVRHQASVMPQGVAWIKDAATETNPEAKTVTLASGAVVGYDYLVVCPGIQLDWDQLPGLSEALETPAVSSNYRFELAPKTWNMIRALRSGTAVFTMPAGPIKCAGAPQKIAYLAADYWREQGVLDAIRMVLVLPTPGMFGVKEFSDELDRVVADYGIEVRFSSEVTSIDAEAKTVSVRNNTTEASEDLGYDFLHAVPPQSAPDWLKNSALADPDNPAGYVAIDKNTLRHTTYPEVFALGDAGSSPNSKTGAAIRQQAPVLVKNLLAAMSGKTPSASYGGYASCPLTTSRHTMLLAEFDYSMRPAPSIPFIDTTHERKDMWYLKRYGLPFMYWNLILKGRA
ncbi:pyridine nucleotide-disulfide oxidoreductase [Glutamicibacter sp. BW78]|uniref:NAD(P)/FAD-dependent oxidoreductase n=1 Tax=Glutamicibacter sp. BW78 TaxID=2024403 RepID=UPI000BB69184|nr:FAD/NAD(P)-binding oxidoreductase [Glutamicibacter sp. BW78]PCC24698.1 pyridine nucleotide-disulfide oxidoreductase [Glutamicibacter sp. BW78]